MKTVFTVVVVVAALIIGVVGLYSLDTTHWTKINDNCVVSIHTNRHFFFWNTTPDTRTTYCQTQLGEK